MPQRCVGSYPFPPVFSESVDDTYYAICDSISSARPWPSFVIPSYGYAGGLDRDEGSFLPESDDVFRATRHSTLSSHSLRAWASSVIPS